MRFNPPPNWPPPPPGWAPDANWAPDPSWPPAPVGWPLWLDDGGNPVAAPASRSRNRTVRWLSLAAAVVVALTVAGLVFGGRLTAHSPFGKPDITTLTSDMLVSRDQFPDPTGKKWISGVNNPDDNGPDTSKLMVDPPECAVFYLIPKNATQTATATLAKLEAGGLNSTRVRLVITPDRPNLKTLMDKCRTFEQSIKARGGTVTNQMTLAPVQAAGIPPWAVATTVTFGREDGQRLPMTIATTTILGYYRGVLVMATTHQIALMRGASVMRDTSNMDDLVKLFTTQVEKLAAVP